MNACPNASTTPRQVSCEKSGANRNASPLCTPGSMSELTQNTMSSKNSNGIMMLDMRSMPFCTPLSSTAKLMTRKTIVNSTILTGDPTKSLNMTE